MLAGKFENQYSIMLEQLTEINGAMNDSIENLNASLTIIKQTLISLKERNRMQPFIDDDQEIRFFKYTKPRFYAWQVYYLELHNIISSVPIGTDEVIKNYYINEIAIIDRFFKIHAFHYQYYLKNESCKDQIFFLRRHRSLFPPSVELNAIDPEFSTELDHLFGRFRANEMLRDFLIRKVKLLIQESYNGLANGLFDKGKRSWSGDKVELIEIAYGIYYTGRINHGKAEISEIIKWLEESLNIDLSQAYRMFVDIRRRKTISYTKYLDEMRSTIQSQIEDSFKFRSKIK
ncbi:RteC domain-containing protein [Sphingobacterium sp. HSC-15S19]|uniref:RteC domain-containing protein n=1 Tax=Sphingobacterium TaxID=28453 RepID=UPI003D2274C8